MENNKTQNKSSKKTPDNKRRGNQREIWLSAGGIGVLFLCLMIYLGHFVATSEQDMINNSYNSRQQIIKKDINERFGGMTEDKHIWLQIAYTHDRAAAEQFRTEVEAEFPGYDIHIDPLSLSVACHIGPGALALACCKKITV